MTPEVNVSEGGTLIPGTHEKNTYRYTRMHTDTREYLHYIKRFLGVSSKEGYPWPRFYIYLFYFLFFYILYFGLGGIFRKGVVFQKRYSIGGEGDPFPFGPNPRRSLDPHQRQ